MSIFNIESMISDLETSVTRAGYQASIETLWIPEFGWDESETKASEPPFPPQYLAALQIFVQMFLAGRAWIHLAAEMQAGKTGVITTLIRLVLHIHNHAKLSIRPTNIFILTGMNDNSWRIQTSERLPRNIRTNVYHSSGLEKVKAQLLIKAANNELDPCSF